ncbi:MAG: hypothetical protein ACOX7K_01720 [Oscillospiraceae bacterium]
MSVWQLAPSSMLGGAGAADGDRSGIHRQLAGQQLQQKHLVGNGEVVFDGIAL